MAPASPTACSAFSSEVHERALEQAPVGAHGGRGPVEVQGQLDARGEAGLVGAHDLLQHRAWVLGGQLVRGRPRERGELGDDAAQRAHLLEDRVGAGLERAREVLAAVREHAAQVLRGELDGGQRVLDLVRDLARHVRPGGEAVAALEVAALARAGRAPSG